MTTHSSGIGTAPAGGWAARLERIDASWQRIEAVLCAAVLAAEILSLTLWVSLRGLSTDYVPDANASGLVYRSTVTAALFGIAMHLATRGRNRVVATSLDGRQGPKEWGKRIAVTAAVVAGFAAGRVWAHVGVAYASNVLNWLQNASALMLIGGLRGLATRLTLWLALLGASLATSRGKHIRIDAVLRYVPTRFARPTAIVGQIAAAAMCAFAVVGFLDYISIAAYRAAAVAPCPSDMTKSCEATARQKLATVTHEMKLDFFLLGRQLSLDSKSLAKVVAGTPYDKWMTAEEWNDWLDGGRWTAHFDEAAVDALHMVPPDSPAAARYRIPQVAVPGTGEEARGLLVRELTLVFPLGLAVLAAKFLLRARLVLGGRVPVDPDASHEEEDLARVRVFEEKRDRRAPTYEGRAGLGFGLAVVALVTAVGGVVAGLVVVLGLLGTPLFAIMGGSAELLWLTHADAAYRHLRFLAPTVLDERFADSPILVTVPLFTFVGYVLAEAKTPDRLVAAARSMLGWLPGGLASVAVVASAVFTVLTGGSGVTIIAIGGLLYPALRKAGYSEKFALGLVITGGSVGLLLPYSLPLLVYSLVAHVDYIEVFKAVLVPGLLVIVLLAGYCAWVGTRERIAREPPKLSQIAGSFWDLKWELGIPVLLAGGLATGLTSIDEAAALVAFYTIAIEFFVYRDLSLRKDLIRIAKASMSLAGAIILILAMANSLMNYVVDQHVPAAVLDFMTKVGIRHTWQFLIVMNVFLLVLGMLMEGFSAILVGVPLILPFVAKLGNMNPAEKMSPFQLAMIFLLNLEIAYCMPPLGLNLFISSFRFNRPVTSLYRVVMPFVGILSVGLVLVTYVPWLSNVAVAGDRLAARAKAASEGVAPRDAWMMECVQEDSSNPQPCTQADMTSFPGGQLPAPSAQLVTAAPSEDEDQNGRADSGCNPDFDDCTDAGAR